MIDAKTFRLDGRLALATGSSSGIGLAQARGLASLTGIGTDDFKTELAEALARDSRAGEWLIDRTPSRRWGDVEDSGGAFVFSASDASRFVNGHILCVDGGVTASL